MATTTTGLNGSNTFAKGLIMAIVSVVAGILSTSGLPTTSRGWVYLLITVLGTVLVYLGKNAVFPSKSVFGSINLKDFLSGLLLAIGGAISQFIASVATGDQLDTHKLFTYVLAVLIGYLGKTLVQESQNLQGNTNG